MCLYEVFQKERERERYLIIECLRYTLI